MSEFMQSFAGRRNGSSGRARPPLQTNIALQITGHDLTAPNGGVVHGIVRAPDWLAGDEVSVRLTTEAESLATFRQQKWDGAKQAYVPYSDSENQKFFRTRPTIQKLMEGFKVGKNDIEPMQAGGLLMFYGATKDQVVEGAPTVWKAQYPENYGNDASRDIIHGAGRISLDVGGEGKRPRAYLDVLFPDDAKVITSIDGLKAYYEDFMQGEVNGVDHSAQSVIRLISQDGGVKSLFTYSARNSVDIPGLNESEAPRKVGVSAPAAQTFKEAVEEGKQAKGLLKVLAVALGANYTLDANGADMAGKLKNDLTAGKIKIEAIPGRRIPVVGSSLEDLLDADSKLSKQAKRCLVSVEGRADKAPGFVKMTVGLMTSPAKGGGVPDNTIVTKFAADEFAKARTVDYLATANHTPVFTRDREKEAEKAAEAAASAGGIEQSPMESPGNDGDEPQAQADNDRSGPGM